MEVVEVEGVDAEAFEGGLAGPLQVVEPPVEPGGPPRPRAAHAAAGADHDLVGPAGDGPAHQAFDLARGVEAGGVDEGHARVERLADQAERLGVVDVAVGAGEGK